MFRSAVPCLTPLVLLACLAGCASSPPPEPPKIPAARLPPLGTHEAPWPGLGDTSSTSSTPDLSKMLGGDSLPGVGGLLPGSGSAPSPPAGCSDLSKGSDASKIDPKCLVPNLDLMNNAINGM